MTKETQDKWPSRISNDENADYIPKIKLEYIKSATVERDDLYYEYASCEYFMTIDLEVNGEPSHALLWGEKSYRNIENMIRKSGEFDCESEVPNQIGRYTYTRKQAKK